MSKASPKPESPPCRFCDGAYWRYNGTSWYACDRVTKKRHVCATPAAVEEQHERERQRLVSQARYARQQRRSARWRIVGYGIVSVVVGLLVWGWWSSRHVYHGPPGGTAECRDGTISYAAHHQGACSYHDGVYAWNR